MKISVLMLSYNRPKYLRVSIDSILTQTHDDWELIVVDDSDNKETIDILESLNDERIIVNRLKARKQIAIKRDIGLNQATGKMLTPLDDDDIAKPNRLSDINSAGPAGFLYGLVEYIQLQPDGSWKEVKSAYAPLSFKKTTIKINGGAVAFNTELAIKVGGYCDRIGTLKDKKSMCGEDWSIYRRILQKASSYKHVPTVWSTIRRHNTNISKFR